MSPLATVLYEDTMLPNPEGNYPLHDLVMRMVEDDINGQTWKLRKLDIEPIPCRGVSKVLAKLKNTSRIAGRGVMLLLVDRDKIHRELKLEKSVSDHVIEAAIRERSNAPTKVFVYLLEQNLEGLLRTLQACNPALLPSEVQSALRKNLNDRDIVLKASAKATNTELRRCIRDGQTGLNDLVLSLNQIIGKNVKPWP